MASSLSGSAQSSALEVTSDTHEYCARLLGRLTDLVRLSPTPPPPEVSHLSSEGQRMCDQGQTRGGILRLRRAWLLMTHPDASAHQQDMDGIRQDDGTAAAPDDARPAR
jgi:hypothetical protein